MVIWPGVGPGRQSLWSSASPPTAGSRRLVGPADWSGTEPTCRPRRSRVLWAADYCSRNANDACLVRGAWLQSRRLAGDHCSHSASYLVNGARTPRGEASCSGSAPSAPTGQGLPSFGFSLEGRARRLWAVSTGRRGSMAPSGRGDVMAEVATVLHWAGISAYYGALWPRSILDMGVMGGIGARPRLVVFMWVQTLRKLWAAC